jgi:putative nucleotidyltransferase with HDIG domain
MNKISVPVSCCDVGDILADDVNNDRGTKLVSKDTILNQYIKDKFIEMGISNVWTYKPDKLLSDIDGDVNYNKIKKNYKEIVLSMKRVLNELAVGGKLDCEKIFDISQSVLGAANESGSVVKCLAEIKIIDEDTHTHCLNVAFYSMLIAKWLNLSDYKIHEIVRTGLLHDIGKVKIPDKILNKKGRLTPSEFEVMKKHSMHGYNLIKNISEFSESIKNAVLMHHERLDGSGYPYGISGDSIGLYARIVSVADVYDAMTRDRIYKKKATPFEAFQMFLTTGITAFDMVVLKTFLNNLPAYYIGTKVKLNNGEVGEIVYVPPHDIVSPVIRVAKRYYDLANTNELKVLSMV